MSNYSEQLRQGFMAADRPNADEKAWDRYVRTGKDGPPSDARLLVWDALSIHNFVFDTTNAIGIRGGSDILRQIDEALRTGEPLCLKEEQVLFAGGGGGMAVVTKEQADKARGRLLRFFAESTLTATCAVDAITLDADQKSFKKQVAEIHIQLERKRALQAPDCEPDVPFFVERCQICGRRAVAIDKPRKHRQRKECAVCLMRLERGRKLAKDETEDYERIAGKSKAIAVMYADGNRFGKLFADLESPLQYRSLSTTIAKVFKSAVNTAAAEHDLILDEKKEGKNFYQRPILAGDDVVAILPGDLAVPFARSFLKAVENLIDEKAQEDEVIRGLIDKAGAPVGAAAGIAIGKMTFPIRQMLDEAEALMKRAKKLVYTDRKIRSAMDFMVIDDGTPRAESQKAPRLLKKRDELLAFGRPYSLEEMDRFIRRFKIVRALAKSQLHALHRIAEAGPQQLRNHILFQIGRFEKWQEAIEALSPEGRAAGEDKEHDVAQIQPTYGHGNEKYKVFDIADMLMIDRYWRDETKEAR